MIATYFAQNAADLAVRLYVQYKIYVQTRLREHSCIWALACAYSYNKYLVCTNIYDIIC
jgi:hypothetical protein